MSEFKKKFENPILRGRDADASDADHKKGTEKLVEVNNLQELHNNIMTLLIILRTCLRPFSCTIFSGQLMLKFKFNLLKIPPVCIGSRVNTLFIVALI